MKKLKELKQSIYALEGKEVIVVLKEQRGKIEQHQGVICKVYPHFFNILTVGRNSIEYSFKHVDILTGEIAVQSVEDENLIVHNHREKKVFDVDFAELASSELGDNILSVDLEDEEDLDLDEIEPPTELLLLEGEVELEFPYDEDEDQIIPLEDKSLDEIED